VVKIGKRVIYIPREKEDMWERFKKACKRDGTHMSEVIVKKIEEWMVSHEPGNPQTAISSFSEGGQTTLSNIEGRVRQMCLECKTNLYHREVLQWIKDLGVKDGKARIAMAERVVSWLKAHGLVIYR